MSSSKLLQKRKNDFSERLRCGQLETALLTIQENKPLQLYKDHHHFVLKVSHHYTPSGSDEASGGAYIPLRAPEIRPGPGGGNREHNTRAGTDG